MQDNEYFRKRKSNDQRKSVAVIVEEEKAKKLKLLQEEEELADEGDGRLGVDFCDGEKDFTVESGVPPFSPVSFYPHHQQNFAPGQSRLSRASFLCHKNQSVVGKKEKLKDKEELEEDQEEEEVLSQGQEEVEDLEEAHDGGNEEEISDNQQRVLSEALEELGVECDEFKDTRQENNLSLYLLPVEDSIGSEDELSNMHFDGGFNVEKIHRVNQDRHFIRDCKELIEGLWKVFAFFSYSINSKTKRVQQLRI